MQTSATEHRSAVEDTVELPPPPDRRVPAPPVFVDSSGRRQRRVRRIGRLLVLPAIAYVGLLASTLLGGPTIDSPYLPLPGGAHSSHAPTHTPTGPSGATPTVTATGHGAGATAGTGSASRPSSGASGSASSVPVSPGASATASAVAPSPSRGRSGQTAPPPGASHRPVKKA